MINVRLVVLAGTAYEKFFSDFATRMNTHLKSCGLKINIVKSTFPSLGRMLFNNNDNHRELKHCTRKTCLLCKHTLQSSLDHVKSTTTGFAYQVDPNLSCTDGGIYVVKGICGSQYTGQTVDFSKRFYGHFSTQKTSSVFQHKNQCHQCYTLNDFEVTLVESYHDRGKFCLSEREYLWNTRMKGTINIQKTLKSN
jgi:predicted GIY-YIG superfamily endonuclease